MQSKNTLSDTDTVESKHRAVGREETLPNFVSRRTDETHAAPDGQDITQCAGDETVSVVRDGDEYLIISSNGENAEAESMGIEREPAIRHAVVQGERLWRIPDNWTQYLKVQNDDAPDQVLYRIPEPTVYVVVRAPRQDVSDETRYHVEKVGSVEAQLNEQLDRDALHDLISTVEEEEDESEEVLTALHALEDQWHNFERDYTNHMNKWGSEAVWGLFKSEDKAVVESWSFNPWEAELDITELLPSRDIDNDVRSRVAARLIKSGIASPSPAFKVHLKNGERLPPGYFVQALTEAGCSPAEIVDWIMVKTRGHTQTTWSDVRDEHEPQVVENITAADRTLTS